MQKALKAHLARGLFLDRDIAKFREQVAQIQPLLSRQNRISASSLSEFDAATERVISDVFGEASEFSEAYAYAKLGEAASLVNLPEEAQEHGAQDLERESLQQRKGVLDSCISQLEKLRTVKTVTDFRVGHYVSTDLRSIGVDATLRDAARLLKKWNVSSLLVLNGTHYVGVVTDTDLSRKAMADGLDPSSTAVGVCMTKPLISIEHNDPVINAVDLMREHGIRHVAVTKDDMVIGVLSVSDVVRYYSETVPALRHLAGLTDNGSS
jgi:signal-transduction protein with cAMP-binding, CBS, and nucleotidyltransferase domain